LQVAARRFHGVHILIIPARVQGDGSAAEIARAIELANRLRPPLDVLVVGRGGGSLEDLWSFNEEVVVRAIFASRIPVVSAVGHEVDVTLADLVADVRALTPSEAAERVIPSAEELASRLAVLQRRLVSMLRSRAAGSRSRLDQLARARVFRNPQSLIYDLAQRLDDLDQQSFRAIRRRLVQLRRELAASASRAEALSPLAVLGRGYSMTTRMRDGAHVRSPSDVRIGESITSRLAEGQIESQVVSASGVVKGRSANAS
jgi:exodeoxyribonuclease VII large subunit